MYMNPIIVIVQIYLVNFFYMWFPVFNVYIIVSKCALIYLLNKDTFIAKI